VIRSPEKLREFDRWYAQTRSAKRSYHDALAIYEALWRHARQLRPDWPSDWRTDIEADIELARVLNGLRAQR
jgi:hypothetical protein